MLTENQVIQIQQINVEAFFSRIESIIDKKLGVLTTNPLQPAEKSEKLVTTKEAEIILGVSSVCLWKWRQKGIITGYRIGKLVKYRESELLASLSKINSKK